MKRLSLSLILLFSVTFAFSQSLAPDIANAATSGTLTVKGIVTYSSPYYYAVWIKNPGGTFLRTLTMYGSTSKYYSDLVHWSSESALSKVNAITGATKSSSGIQTATWNAQDQANSYVVNDGDYTVSIEMTSEAYGTNSKYITSTFTKGSTAQTLTPANVAPLSTVSIQWTPTNTALNEIDFNNQYCVYPNPTRSIAYINGFDIKEIEIISLNGKSLFFSNNQRIDLTGYPKGIYLAKLITSSGTYMQKIEKL